MNQVASNQIKLNRINQIQNVEAMINDKIIADRCFKHKYLDDHY